MAQQKEIVILLVEGAHFKLLLFPGLEKKTSYEYNNIYREISVLRFFSRVGEDIEPINIIDDDLDLKTNEISLAFG